MIELDEIDIYYLLDYIDSCRNTGHNQEMDWNQLVSYHNIVEATNDGYDEWLEEKDKIIDKKLVKSCYYCHYFDKLCNGDFFCVLYQEIIGCSDWRDGDD